MEEMKITQKIAHLRDLIENPEPNVGVVLRRFHDLFQLTHEGRDLSPESLDWLNQTARLFLSPKLLAVLVKFHLEVYGFHFAALNFTDVDDVIDDIFNGGVLKDIHSFPPGAFNKLKRHLVNPVERNYLNQPVVDMPPCTDTKVYKSSGYSEGSLAPCPQQVMVPRVQLPKIGTKFDVKVISVLNPSHFYVLPLENLPDFITLKRQLKDSEYVGCDWIITGGFYVYWCPVLEEFKRVRVLKSIDVWAEIFFIDEGGILLITDCRKLRYLSPELAKLPAQAIRAKLYGVKPNDNCKWSDKNVLFFKEFVMDEAKTFTAVVMGILPNESLILKLNFLDGNHVSVAQVLIDNVHASSSLASQ